MPGGSGEGPRWKCGMAPLGIGGEPCGVLCLTCCNPGWCCRPACCCCCCIIWWWSGVPLMSPASSSPPSSSSSSSPPLSAKSCGPLCSCAAPYCASVSVQSAMWDATRDTHVLKPGDRLVDVSRRVLVQLLVVAEDDDRDVDRAQH